MTVALPISIFKEGKTFVAHSSVIDLSSCGKTRAEAERRFNEAALIFFEELVEHGTETDVLSNLGWTRVKKILETAYARREQNRDALHAGMRWYAAHRSNSLEAL